MKKISLLIAFIFIGVMCCFVKANAATLGLSTQYVQINVGNDEMLEIDGYEKVAGIVDWSKVGEYVVTYIDDENTIYKKQFVILNGDDNCFINSSDICNFEVSVYHDVIDVVNLDENRYYIISNYETESTYYDQEKVSIMYYENHQFQWEYRYYKYSRYIDCILNGESLIVIGEVYNEDSDYIKTIIMFEINKNRMIINSKEFSSGNGCYAKAIYLYKNYLYLITNSSGNENDYLNINPNKNNQLVIFKINVEDFGVVYIRGFNDLNLFNIIDCSFYESRIAINISLKDNYVIDNTKYNCCIVEVDEDLNYIDRYYYDTTKKDYKGFTLSSNDICIFYINNDDYQKSIKVQYLNHDVKYKILPLEIETNNIINSVNVVKCDKNNIYLGLNYVGYVSNNYLGFAKINSYTGADYYIKNDINLYCFKTNFKDGNIINWYYSGGKNNELLSKSFEILEYKTVSIDSFYKISTYKNVMFNFSNLSKISLGETGEYDNFGIYYGVDYFQDINNNSYYFQRCEEVLLQSNLNEGEVYQPGYVVEFNGEGILNGEIIFSGYEINNVGKYLLEIKGKNDVKETINFEIRDLTINPIDKSYNVNVKDIEIVEGVHKNDPVVFTNYELSGEISQTAIPIALSILVLGIFSLVFLRKKI